MRFAAAGFTVFCLSMMGLVPLYGDLPQPMLEEIFPPGGFYGTTVEVTIKGKDLDEPSLVFSRPGWGVKPGTNAQGAVDPTKFLVQIPQETAPGHYEVRVHGLHGISNPRVFQVGMVMDASSPKPKTSLQDPTPLKINQAVASSLQPQGVDYYRIEFAAKQKASVVVFAKSIDSKCEPVLTWVDAQGLELRRVARSEGVMEVAPDTAGPIFLKVHDLTFRGGVGFFYRLVIHTHPQVEFTLPSAIPEKGKHKVTLFGRNLPGGIASTLRRDGSILEQSEVEVEFDPSKGSHVLPLNARPHSIGLRQGPVWIRNESGPSFPVFLGQASGKALTEQADNNSSESAQKIVWPCDVTGQFFPSRDQDWYQFDAKKGTALRIEVVAQRQGFSVDPMLVLYRVIQEKDKPERLAEAAEWLDGEANVGGIELNTTTLDIMKRWEVPEDGTYRIRLQDTSGAVLNRPDLIYRLSIGEAVPDFSLMTFVPMPPLENKDLKQLKPWALGLRQGETQPIRVQVSRRDGFSGAVALSVRGLPPGVSAAPAQIPSGTNGALIFLTATPEAVAWVGPLEVLGKSLGSDPAIEREAHAASISWPVTDYTTESVRSRWSDRLLLSVSDQESFPLSVESSQVQYEVAKEGKLEVPLVVRRIEGFQAALKLRVGGPGNAAKEIDVAEKVGEAKVELDLKQFKLPVGTNLVFIEGRSAGKWRKKNALTSRVEAELKTIDTQLAEHKSQFEAAEKNLAAATEETKPGLLQTRDEAQRKLKETEAARLPVAERAAPLSKIPLQDMNVVVWGRPFQVVVKEVAKP